MSLRGGCAKRPDEAIYVAQGIASGKEQERPRNDMLWINHLRGFERLTLHQVARVHVDLTIGDADGEEIKRARGGRIFDHALLVELRVVAGADEFLRGGVPGDGAAEMRAAMIDREESAVAEAHDVKASVGNVRDRVGREIVHKPSVDDRAEFAFGESRLEIGDEYASGFYQGKSAKECPGNFEKVAAGGGDGRVVPARQ